MTDNEIKKALECWSSYSRSECAECQLYAMCDSHPEDIPISTYALDLINRQQAKIEEYKKIIKASKDSVETYKGEIKKLVINVRTEAIKEVLDEITEILHEAEMHGNYEPSLTIEIINDIKEKMRVDNG